MPKHPHLSRRDFLRTARTAAIATGIGVVAPNIFLNRTKAATGENPSEFIRIGFIGVGGQGNSNLGALMKNAVAVCDVDQTRVQTTKARIEQANGRPCAVFSDYRKMLDDKSIDAVLIATPDHWHTLPAIHACEAGKDVYCEKPLTLFIDEGRVLVETVRRTRRVFQTGSQQRSDAKFLKGCEYVRSGRLGKIKTIKVGLPTVNYLERAKPPVVPDSKPPEGFDYEMWLGPAPHRPYNKNHVHYLFRFFWDYSGGQMTNFGAHHLDIAQWGLGMDDSGPVEIEGTAVYNPEKLYETPQSFDVTYKYANGTVVLCNGGGGKYPGGTTFEGERGTIFVSRGNLESTPEEILARPLDDKSVRLYASKEHHENWLDCIKSRKDPICNVETGHRSATVCHLGNIAIRSGKKVNWDPVKQQIVGDAELAKWTSRPYRAPWKLPA
ncbi:MAG: Gfo/Idh/MocA family oxidoreductase [Verrucomicrobia bacterium]|nr:Gfo/Idh/MocA family oxidoreductase [Verrucomicrobiota bacterium]